MFKAILLAILAASPALAAEPIRIGILTDMSGVYQTSGGKGSVVAAQMAAELFGNKIGDRPIEILSADHQNKPDVGSAIARQWIDVDHVDVIADMPNSAITLALMDFALQRNKIVLATASGAAEVSGSHCNEVTLQWTFDSYQMAASTVRPVIERGGTTWFHVMPNYVFGDAVLRDVSAQVVKNGGTNLGNTRPPLDANDFSAFLLAAQGSGAKVLSLGTANTATQTAVKQAAEFGLTRSMMIAAVSLLDADVKALGLATAQGILTAHAFVPDRTPQIAAWSAEFKRRHGALPSFTQAGTFSAIRHYLQAVKDSGTTDTAIVLAKMKATPVNDIFATNGHIRADGVMVHDWYLRQVKSPAESTGPDDLLKLLAVIPGEQIVRPLSESQCRLVHPKG